MNLTKKRSHIIRAIDGIDDADALNSILDTALYWRNSLLLKKAEAEHRKPKRFSWEMIWKRIFALYTPRQQIIAAATPQELTETIIRNVQQMNPLQLKRLCLYMDSLDKRGC